MNTIPISRDAVEQALESLRAAKEYMRLPEYHQALRDTHDSEMFLAEAIAQADQSAMPQAQAGEPEGDLTIAYMCGFEKGKDFMREAIAKKDDALRKCVEAMQAAKLYQDFPDQQVDAAITQAQEQLK